MVLPSPTSRISSRAHLRMLWCYCAFVIRYPLGCNLWNASLFPPALVHSRACPLPSQCLTAVLGREDPALMPILAFLFDCQTHTAEFLCGQMQRYHPRGPANTRGQRTRPLPNAFSADIPLVAILTVLRLGSLALLGVLFSSAIRRRRVNTSANE